MENFLNSDDSLIILIFMWSILVFKNLIHKNVRLLNHFVLDTGIGAVIYFGIGLLVSGPRQIPIDTIKYGFIAGCGIVMIILSLYEGKINSTQTTNNQSSFGPMGSAYFDSGWESKFEQLDPRNKNINPLKIIHRFEGQAINYDGWKQKFAYEDHKKYVNSRFIKLFSE